MRLTLFIFALIVIAALAYVLGMQGGFGPAAVNLAGGPCVDLTKPLYWGVTDAKTGGEVSKLQQYLALDSKIYPEARVTGVFGPATMRAVIRWQAANSIPKVGAVGPLTRAAMFCQPGETPVTPPPPTTSTTTPPPVAATNLPTCTLTANKEEYYFNDRVELSWTTTDATHVTFFTDTSADLQLPVGGTYGTSGSITVTANISGNPRITLKVFGDGGESSCKTTITIRD